MTSTPAPSKTPPGFAAKQPSGPTNPTAPPSNTPSAMVSRTTSFVDRDKYLTKFNYLTIALSKLPGMTPLHKYLRDSGAFATIADTLTVLFGPFLLLYEAGLSTAGLRLLSSYPNLARTAIPVPYGAHNSQTSDLYLSQPSSPTSSLIIFVHGGAWGSGFRSMYFGIALSFLKKGYDVALVGYRVFPEADVAGQCGDVRDAIEAIERWRVEEGGKWKSVTLIGHSSGAHISLQSRLRSPTPFVTHLACLSGVYDLAAHSEYEKARGLDELSTLKGAGGYTREKMEECSLCADLLTPPEHFPSALLYHGLHDLTVPFTQTCFATAQLRDRGMRARAVFDDGDHVSPVLSCFGFLRTETRCFEEVLKFIEADGEEEEDGFIVTRGSN